MNCISCRAKTCRAGVSCGIEAFNPEETMQVYHRPEEQKMIQAAAGLVDDGRAGTLSRIEELIEFAREMEYRKVGLAYCYGMESLAKDVRNLFMRAGIPAVGISCTVGAFSQSSINEASDLPGVSCNPVNQAAQLTAEGVDLAVVIGLCLGHDIIFNREFRKDVTTLVVKDRTNDHSPVAGIRELLRRE
jgi:uncharacterized metal-binding protein